MISLTDINKNNDRYSIEMSPREKAMQRIAQTQALKSIKNMRGVHWNNCDNLWNWLATAPLDDLLTTTPDLEVHEIRQRAFHEAGHAILGCLTYQDLLWVTIVPETYGNQAGEAMFETEMPISIFDSAFLVWRSIVQILAGPFIDEKLTGKLGSKKDMDIAKAISYIRLTTPLDYQMELCDVSLASVASFLRHPNI